MAERLADLIVGDDARLGLDHLDHANGVVVPEVDLELQGDAAPVALLADRDLGVDEALVAEVLLDPALFVVELAVALVVDPRQVRAGVHVHAPADLVVEERGRERVDDLLLHVDIDVPDHRHRLEADHRACAARGVLRAEPDQVVSVRVRDLADVIARVVRHRAMPAHRRLEQRAHGLGWVGQLALDVEAVPGHRCRGDIRRGGGHGGLRRVAGVARLRIERRRRHRDLIGRGLRTDHTRSGERARGDDEQGEGAALHGMNNR